MVEILPGQSTAVMAAGALPDVGVSLFGKGGGGASVTLTKEFPAVAMSGGTLEPLALPLRSYASRDARLRVERGTSWSNNK